jgi:hypothetical protein
LRWFRHETRHGSCPPPARGSRNLYREPGQGGATREQERRGVDALLRALHCQRRPWLVCQTMTDMTEYPGVGSFWNTAEF